MNNKELLLGKKENIKIIMIIILTSTFFLGILFSNENQVAKLLQEPFFAIDFNKIAKIETELEGTITKSGKGWELTYNNINLPIDERRVSSMIQALEKLQKNKLVSRDPKIHKELGIKENPDFKLFDDKNNLLTEIFIGNPGEGDTRLAYIKSNNDNVYLTNNIFLSYKGNSYNTFANTKLFSNREENTKLESLILKVLKKPNKDEEDAIQNDYNISTKDGLYFFNQEVLHKERLLQTIQEFSTDGFEIDTLKINDYRLQYNIEVTWNNKSVNNIDIYLNKNEKDSNILMKKDNDIYYHITTKWAFFDVFNLEKNIKDSYPNEGSLHNAHDHDHDHHHDHPHDHDH
ncbi:DUF4340 domain-containing protein [Candidatus Borreliella tachyglossi]|uniref:DUF4340 domain-containing protein n=1 Tax=Candidatus Borreliella tachyglossi TaxID=1964448 RepID=UPI004042D866